MRALLALPLQWDTVNLGVPDIYRTTPGNVSDAQWHDTLATGDTAALLMLTQRTDPGDGDGAGGWLNHGLGLRAEIHQATGMVLVQLDVGAIDAWPRMCVRGAAAARRGRPRHRPRRLVFTQHMTSTDAVTEEEGPVVSHPEREQRVSEAFVALADTLVDDYDIIDLLDQLVAHCVSLLAADAAGIMLGDARRELRAVAASSEDAQTMELLQLQAAEGPCLECYNTVAQVRVPDISEVADRWPTFVAAVANAGAFVSVHAIPLRLRGQAIGALNLFHRQPGPLPASDLALGQALADVATIGILSERAIRHSEVLNEQLQTALNSRVIIEQAKGVLAQHLTVDMDTAFDRLRRYARTNNLRLVSVARQVVAGELDLDLLTSAQRASGSRSS